VEDEPTEKILSLAALVVDCLRQRSIKDVMIMRLLLIREEKRKRDRGD